MVDMAHGRPPIKRDAARPRGMPEMTPMMKISWGMGYLLRYSSNIASMMRLRLGSAVR